MTFIFDLARHLEARGIGTLGTDLFVGQLPPEPVQAVLLVATGGSEPDRPRGVERPSIQVTVRSPSHAAAHEKVHAVYRLLDGMPQALLGTSAVTWCRAMQHPACLGTDEQQAWRFVCNFRFGVER